MTKPEKSRLIITCDEPPRPPLNGNNRKAYEVVRALSGTWDIHLLAYPLDDADWQLLQETWAASGVQCHRLHRRPGGRHWRMVTRRELLPSATRNFPAEAALVRELTRGRPGSRLLIDFISGAPLLREINGAGVILSGHDCMSYLFGEEARFSRRLTHKWHRLIRRELAKATEERYSHLASYVHVVSEQDAAEFRKVNPRTRPFVIPLGGSGASEGDILPNNRRRGGLIWGSLESELILAGVRELFTAARTHAPEALFGWTLLGKVSEQTARQLLPEMAALGVEYHARIERIGEQLGKVRVLLLPDTGGTGQKNRSLDGLAHGCIVCGLSEVFRDFGSQDETAYITAPDYTELLRVAQRMSLGGHEEVSHAARRLFEARFSQRALARQWQALLETAGNLASR